jgi:hypothetical protein
MLRDLSISEISSVFGGSGVAVYTNGSWSYGNACYATAQGAANAGATGFSVNGQFFGTSGNPFTDPDGVSPMVEVQVN